MEINQETNNQITIFIDVVAIFPTQGSNSGLTRATIQNFTKTKDHQLSQ